MLYSYEVSRLDGLYARLYTFSLPYTSMPSYGRCLLRILLTILNQMTLVCRGTRRQVRKDPFLSEQEIDIKTD